MNKRAPIVLSVDYGKNGQYTVQYRVVDDTLQRRYLYNPKSSALTTSWKLVDGPLASEIRAVIDDYNNVAV